MSAWYYLYGVIVIIYVIFVYLVLLINFLIFCLCVLYLLLCIVILLLFSLFLCIFIHLLLIYVSICVNNIFTNILQHQLIMNKLNSHLDRINTHNVPNSKPIIQVYTAISTIIFIFNMNMYTIVFKC